MEMIDLRSDTVTKPTPEMRQAMVTAAVGDDVFGEDPTVNRLQQRLAAMFGKEAALFVASGTMGNQVAINSHTQPGDEVICEEQSHCFNYEGGGAALLSGVQMRPIAGQRGVITAQQISAVLRPKNDHFPQSRLIVLENTHNGAGGTLFPIEEIRDIRQLAIDKGLFIHLDGARLWNAHVATKIPLLEYGKHFDSISVCLSKGLGAPVGSVIIGSADFIHKAHRFRKIYGGGMRQVGILAAAGIYALDHHLDRLVEDHKRAFRMAEKLNSFRGIFVDLESTKTNIVIATMDERYWQAGQVAEELKNKGVLAIPFQQNSLRFVTHLDITDEHIERALKILGQVFDSRAFAK